MLLSALGLPSASLSPGTGEYQPLSGVQMFSPIPQIVHFVDSFAVQKLSSLI